MINNSNLIHIKNSKLNSIASNYKFTCIPVIFQEKSEQDNSIIYKSKKVIIEVIDLKTNLVMVHPITEFVMLWRNKSYNTQKNKADTIVRFLNFILSNNTRFKLKSLTDLNVYHGEEYLSYLTLNGCSEKYFLAERKVLDKFYRFLSQKNLLSFLDEFFLNENQTPVYKNKLRSGIMSISGTIFKDSLYPSNKSKPKRLHHLKEEFVLPFIETAREIQPRIALGIYFQCFGGLRISEVVNVRKSSISTFDWGTVKLEINIADEIISEHYKDYNQPMNKRKRKQVIYNTGDYLPNLLKNHFANSYCATDGSEALFSNKKGDRLTSKMYRYYFNKVKNEFIKKLLKSKNDEIRLYGMFLKIEPWSTHLGRGIASNFIADSTNNAYQVASFRGDTQLNSSLTYTEDTEKYKSMIYESASKMYASGIEMNKTLKKDGDRSEK